MVLQDHPQAALLGPAGLDKFHQLDVHLLILLDQLAENVEEGLVDLLVARELFERGLACLWEEQAVAEA